MIGIRSAALVLLIIALPAAGCGKGDEKSARGLDQKQSPDKPKSSLPDSGWKIRPLRPSGGPTVSPITRQYESKNCSSGTHTRVIAVSELLKSDVSVDSRVTAGAEAGVTIPIALRLSLKAEIERGYRTALERAYETTDKIVVEMPPWTIVTTEIKVEKKEIASVVEFEKAGNVSEVPYRYSLQTPDLSTVSHKSQTCPEKPSSLEIKPGYASLELGQTTQLRATLLDSRNNAIKGTTFSWRSANNNIATVTRDGLVEAVGQGKTTIVAVVDEVQGQAGIKVAQTVARVQIEPANPTITYGSTVRLLATAVDNRDNALSVHLRWSSNDEEVATVSPDGLVQGAWIGRTTVKATTPNGVVGRSEVTIAVPKIAFPERVLVLIVPFHAGSTADRMARAIARALGPKIRRPIVVRDIAGSSGSGAEGWRHAAQARPDGYTMAIYTNKLAKRGVVGVGLGDFETVAMFSKQYGLLVPRGTQKERIMLLDNAVREAVADKAFQDSVYEMKDVPYYRGSLKFAKIANP